MNVGPHPEAADACLDWSEHRPHLGGALGGKLLMLWLRNAWVVPELDSRERLARFGMPV